MGAVSVQTLAGRRLYLDANIFIYAIEKHPEYLSSVTAIFGLIDTGQSTAVTSELTLAECLAKPFADADIPLQQAFQAAVKDRPGFAVLPVTRRILLRAAYIRGTCKLRLPDAIHAAAALDSACDALLTNDRRMPPVPGLSILQFGDLAP